jgi:hypothetical protein
MYTIAARMFTVYPSSLQPEDMSKQVIARKAVGSHEHQAVRGNAMDIQDLSAWTKRRSGTAERIFIVIEKHTGRKVI